MSFGKILNIITKKIIKDLIRFEDSINSLMNEFESGCPPEEEVEDIVKQISLFHTFLNNIENSFSRISTTTDSIESINNILRGVNIFIKTLPVPSAILGVGVPLGFINTFADSLDILKEFIVQNKASVGQANLALNILKVYLSNIINKTNELNELIENCVLKYGREDLLEKINYIKPLHVEEQIDENKELRERLRLDSENPYIYKNYQLILEKNQKNNKLIRIKGVGIVNKDLSIVRKLYEEDDSWSYANDLRVLVEEMKYMIDLFPLER